MTKSRCIKAALQLFDWCRRVCDCM